MDALLLLGQFTDTECVFSAGIPTIFNTVNQGQSDWLAFDGAFNRFGPMVQSVEVILTIRKPVGAGSAGAVRFDEVYFGGTGPGPEPLTLKRWTIDAGGGCASNGGLVLTGSIGQPEPGSASGGGISLQSGFWFGTGSVAPPVGDLIFRNGFE